MNKLLPILLVVMLSGCATGIVASNENSVIVGNTFPWKQQEAFDIADKECSKYNKTAVHIPGKNDGRMRFVCK